MTKQKANKNIKKVVSQTNKQNIVHKQNTVHRQNTIHKHNIRASKKTKSNNWQFPLNKKNLIYIGIGLGVILVGYLLMATGITNDPAVLKGKWDNPFAISVAPIIIVIGYCVIIPYAIVKVFKNEKDNKNSK